MDTTQHESTRTVAHVSLSSALTKKIALLANAEKRSKSAMICILIEEAIEQREK